MNALDRENQYLHKWRPIAVRGDSSAMSNVAAAYRILGNFRLAARWYKRAAEQGDGDAMTDRAYCLQHGVGVRRNKRSAERAYRSAIACKWITDFGREEAMYHLAVLLLGRLSASSRRAAARLLRIANADGDYPQAQSLLRSVRSADARNVCICRRHLRPRLARRHCPLHGPHRGQPDHCSQRRMSHAVPLSRFTSSARRG
jgi:TPR repeat protein